MKPGALVLVTGPVEPTDWWAPVERELSGSGHPVIAPRDHSDEPLFSVSWIASVAQHLNTSVIDSPVVLAGYGTAGPLLPALARAQRAAGRQLAGYVFVDATLPRPGATSHLDLLRAADPPAADVAHDQLHVPGTVWPQQPLPAGARPRDHQFWTETLPPAIDWPDAPCIYIWTREPAPACGDTGFWARSARSRAWPVIERADVAGGVREALDQLPS